jgi:N-acetylneuraminate synthase
MIKGLQRAFPDRLIGYSDHTLPDEGMTALVTSYLLGAVIIEKHFTHDKSLPGNDHYHAMDAGDLKRFIEKIGLVNTLKGPTEHKTSIPHESTARRNARRSIVIARDLPAGHLLAPADLTYKRPGTGVSPLHWDEVLGRRLGVALKEDDVLRWEDLATED